MTPDEVRLLDNKYALLFIRGERPIKDFKYDILKVYIYSERYFSANFVDNCAFIKWPAFIAIIWPLIGLPIT